jgi:putative ABC transport system ATP-binding protein
MIKLIGVEKSYPSPEGGQLTVLQLERLELASREGVALAGPSGSGKTTLLNIITGITTATVGEVWVYGQAVHQMSERERDEFRAGQVGILFQTFNLLPGFSALENILLAMSFSKKIATGQRNRRAKELLERLGLGDRLHHRPRQLSTGQQQRVALARALANKPALLIADEPTASVDFEAANTIMNLLQTSCREDEAILLVASHDPLILNRFDRIIRLNHQGRVEPNPGKTSLHAEVHEL